MAQMHYNLPVWITLRNLQDIAETCPWKESCNRQHQKQSDPGMTTTGMQHTLHDFWHMSIAWAHSYPLEWWRTVWTIFIKNKLSNLNIDKLQCIWQEMNQNDNTNNKSALTKWLKTTNSGAATKKLDQSDKDNDDKTNNKRCQMGLQEGAGRWKFH